MMLKPGLPPRNWLVSWTGFADTVFVAFWVYVELFSGRSMSLL